MKEWFKSLTKAKLLIILEMLCIVILLGSLFNKNTSNNKTIETAVEVTGEKKYIKWVEFNVTYGALDKAYRYDVETYKKEVHLNWIELLAFLGAKYGGDFSRYKEKDMINLANKLINKEETMSSLTDDMKYYSYYLEAYTAVLGGLVGEYEIQVCAPTNTPTPTPTMTPMLTPSVTIENTVTPFVVPQPTITIEAKQVQPELLWEKRYGLKAFSPIARDYYYYGYDDFGVSRSYGYKRQHLGHDMMGSVGTPVIAVESGYVEALGWNKYGGWRIGIRSFDKKRYYYYAHMRKDFPYNKSLEVGSIVTAGDVIGYLGRTGYSNTENTNNITTSHLHFGLQLIFDESQKEGNNEIWVDVYALTKFLYRNRSLTVKNLETKEYSRVYQMNDPIVVQYIENLKNPCKEEANNEGTIVEYE